jgi:hypothetical protein
MTLCRLPVTDLNSMSDSAIVRSARNGEFQAEPSSSRIGPCISACCAIEGVDTAQGRNWKLRYVSLDEP